MRFQRSESGFRAAFFSTCLSLLIMASAWAQPGGASADPVWRALIHWRDSGPSIAGKDFLLSAPQASPEAELQASVQAIWHGPVQDGLCRYPARYAWLRTRLNLPALDLQPCAEVQEFLRRAPADQLSLVFASENLAQPSSMMGHLFLKLEGGDAQGRHQQHAVSFFTDTATWNLPKLLVDSIVVGKPGYFTLSPFDAERRHYVDEEGRTLWEFPLVLQPHQRELMALHLLELRHASLTYFFHRYNCASLIQDLLALASPAVLDDIPWATTPKDVLHAAHRQALLDEPVVHTPARWLLRSTRPTLTPAERGAVDGWVHGRMSLSLPADDTRAFLVWQTAQARVAWMQHEGDLRPAEASQMTPQLMGMKRAAFDALELRAGQQQSPLRAPPDRRWSVGARHADGRHWVTAQVMPASHTLLDDNRTSFAENELRLFDLAMSWSPATRDVRLDQFTIYGTRSLLPWDRWTGGLSGQFRIGWERQVSDQGSALMPVVAGGLGWTWRPMPDIDLFGLATAGLSQKNGAFVYAEPTAGLLVRQVAGMKALAECRWQSTDWTRRQPGAFCSLTQSMAWGPSWRLELSGQTPVGSGGAGRSWGLRLIRIE